MSEAKDVLDAIDNLRRDLSGYHGQLKAHNDLQRHCENQRKRIGELEELYSKSKEENAELRIQLADAIESMGRVEERCAGLREFAQDMMQFFEDGDYCTTCEKAAECNASEIYESDCLMHSVFKDRMRELRVESK